MGDELMFKVLGPLAVTMGTAGVPLGGARQRTILALLLVTPGRVVPIGTMEDTVWNGDPPSTARTQVAICVAGLRKVFKAAGVADDVIVTAHPGYRLNLDGFFFDSLRFAELVQAAERSAREGAFPEAAHDYAQALDLWRGPAFAGVSGQPVEDEAARMEEHRLNAYDAATLVHLNLGRHQELIPELAAMVREYPLRERTRYHLMLAQYRCGRRADAMETYRDAHSRFADELGIDPGPDLKDLHDAVLRDDPSLAPVAEQRPAAATTPAVTQIRTVPRELPADVPAFTGRAEGLAALQALIADTGESRRLTVGLLTGAAGIGKSGLAVHWAYRNVEHFPDGQLFVDLRGYDEHREPVPAHDVLSRFLRSLGVPGGEVPDDPEDRVSLYRSLLTDRRVLVVIDNARTFAQIRPLLPGSGHCTVLVTCRDPMEELVTWPTEARVHLGRLAEAEAVALLTAIVGERRLANAGADTVQLVHLCDRLPLAVRIAAARLASKPHWTVRYLVTRLSDERRRLDELSQGESQVRTSLALSHRYLPDDAARLFRLLGLLEAPDFTAWAGAALLEVDEIDAERLIEGLVDAQFLEVVTIDATGQLRYRLSSLVRLYARERVRLEEPAAERNAALSRYLRTLLTIAEEADRLENDGSATGVHSRVPRRPIDPDRLSELLAVPLTWYETERLALVASVGQAAREGLAEVAWDLTVCASIFFGIRNYAEDCRRCCEAALAAARAAGDPRGEGAMLYLLGTLEHVHSSVENGIVNFTASLRCYELAKEHHGRAMALRSIGIGERMLGELDSAMARFTEAMPIFREVGDRYCEAHTLHNMADAELERGRPESAMLFASDAVRVAERVADNTRVLAQAVHRLGRVHLALGRYDAAEQAFSRAIRIVKEKSDMIGLAYLLLGLGETKLAKGEAKAAESTLAEALAIAADCGSPLATGQINLSLGEVNLQLGHTAAARRHLGAALEQFASVGASAWERRAEQVLGAVLS
jgi:DNA-binding SARP family transcriptional activator